VLAELAERDFAGLDADVAVVTRTEPARVVWSSRPDFPGSRPVDVTMPLLGPPSWGGPRRARPWLPPDAPPGPPGAVHQPAPAWQLVVAHRDGSVAAVVARTRARNLGVGLGVLVLLGGSAALLALSSHRARALARQQIAFVAAVSHELRTPLAAIRSASENLADGVVATPEQVRRYGAMLRREGDRLTALVEKTLDLSGMLGRARPGQRERIDVGDLVSEVLAESPRKGEVEIDVAEGLHPVVGDAAALRSALRNLIDNAQKHGGGDWLAVRARMSPGARRELTLAVEDRGRGVPRSEMGQLFEPFVRGASARDIPGSGLGLSVVQHVARTHGGRVTVTTGPGGRGMAFTLHLPVAPESRA
jgi:two-component system phosphate regulon sensor histidine kinase PhoR